MDTLQLLRTRVKPLNTATVLTEPRCVLYVMSRDCRMQYNHALLAAQQHALKLNVPVVVAFAAYDKPLGNRAAEHVQFLLDGLQSVAEQLKTLNIPFVIQAGDTVSVVTTVSKAIQPAAVYFDFSPLQHARSSKQVLASSLAIPMYVVDTHNVVPVWVASDKQEVGARTLRPKIHKQLANYLQAGPQLQAQTLQYQGDLASEPLAELTKRIVSLYPSNGTDISRFTPGEHAAQQVLQNFISQRLHGYATKRNDPSMQGVSDLSPYLHYGHISSLQLASTAYQGLGNDPSLQADVDAFIEELVVRKELSDNFCYYNPHYRSLQGAPAWAQATLAKHAHDPREFVYTTAEFEHAKTHDPAWNAAQNQLTRTGKMHGYMRMYWAKKVLEWSASPQQALQTLLYLNDFYHIDGGDPNGYVGIMWSVAGVHDRPWGERPIYGTIRSMVFNGLKRKFDVQAYIDAYS